MATSISKERIERVARIYASNQEARQVLGVSTKTFHEICRKYGIETPHARKLRRQQEARAGQ